MFLISNCRVGWDLGLCTFWIIAKREPQRNGDFRQKTCFLPAEKIRIWHCAALLFLQVPKKCTDRDLSLLYILTLGTYSKFAWKNNFFAPGVCFPQACSSAGRRFAASRSRLHKYRRIVSFPQQKNRWHTLSTGFHWESAFVWEIPKPP